MSRVGKSPIELPEGVEAEVTEVGVRVKGRRGELTVPLRDDVEVEKNGNEL